MVPFPVGHFKVEVLLYERIVKDVFHPNKIYERERDVVVTKAGVEVETEGVPASVVKGVANGAGVVFPQPFSAIL